MNHKSFYNFLKSTLNTKGYVDVDWANEADHKSPYSTLVKYGAVIAWELKEQPTVVVFSTETNTQH
jgi:hypothetical protein